MAEASRTLEIIVKLRDLARQGVRRLGRAFSRVRREVAGVRRALFGLKSAFLALTAGVTVGVLAKSFLDAAVTVEQYRTRLKILTGDQQEANEIFRQAAKFAGDVTAEYEDILGTAVTLRGIMKGGVDEVMEWTRLITDVAAVSQIPIQQVTAQIVRMYSSGAAAADLFRERGITAMLGFAAKTQYTAEETREALLKLHRDPLRFLRGASKEMATTWTGLMSMMKDRWFEFRVLVMDQGGVLNFMKAVLTVIIEKLQELSDDKTIEGMAKAFGELLVENMKATLVVFMHLGNEFRNFRISMNLVILGWTRLRQAVNWTAKIAVKAMVQIAKAFEYVIELDVKLGTWIHNKLEALENLANKAPGFAKKIGILPKALKEYFGAATIESDKLLMKTQEWRKEQEEIVKSMEVIKLEIQQQILNLKILINDLRDVEDVDLRIEKVMKRINKLMKDYAEAAEKAKNKPPPPPPGPRLPSFGALAKADLEEFKATNAVVLSNLNYLYEQGHVELERYFQRRRQLVMEQYDLEIKLQQTLLDLEKAKGDKASPDKILQIESNLYKLRQQRALEIVRLNQDENREGKKRIENYEKAKDILKDLEVRVSTTGEFGLASQFQAEQRDMVNRQREEMAQLEELLQGHAEKEKLIEDAKRQYQLEQDRLLHDQRVRLIEEYADRAKDALTHVQDSFTELYEASGKTTKEFFYVAKAAAIAHAIISTYQAAVDAYKAMAGIPIVGPKLAPIAAAAAIAAGMAKVEAIRRTSPEGSFAEGGIVPFKRRASHLPRKQSGGVVGGVSPSPKSDDKVVRVTSGEFIHPVASVKHYGRQAMEALRARVVPKDALLKLVSRVPIPKVPSVENRQAYATGGVVTSAAPTSPVAAAGSFSVGPFNITAEQPLSDRIVEAVEDAVINVMRQEAM